MSRPVINPQSALLTLNAHPEVVLDILFPVEKETQQCAEKMFDSIARNSLYDIPFQILRAEMGERFWESFAEPTSKHDDELWSR
jgi:hypothetical protein